MIMRFTLPPSYPACPVDKALQLWTAEENENAIGHLEGFEVLVTLIQDPVLGPGVWWAEGRISTDAHFHKKSPQVQVYVYNQTFDDAYPHGFKAGVQLALRQPYAQRLDKRLVLKCVHPLDLRNITFAKRNNGPILPPKEIERMLRKGRDAQCRAELQKASPNDWPLPAFLVMARGAAKSAQWELVISILTHERIRAPSGAFNFEREQEVLEGANILCDAAIALADYNLAASTWDGAGLSVRLKGKHLKRAHEVGVLLNQSISKRINISDVIEHAHQSSVVYPDWVHSHVQVRTIPGRGRGIVAVAPLAAGDVVLLDHPIAVSRFNMRERMMGHSPISEKATYMAMSNPHTLGEKVNALCGWTETPVRVDGTVDFYEIEKVCGANVFHIEDVSEDIVAAYDVDTKRFTEGDNLSDSRRRASYRKRKEKLQTRTHFIGPSKAERYGLYPFAAFLNHDCHPNCLRSFVGTNLIVSCMRDISVDEELCISYVGWDSDVIERQARLSDWGFNCACGRCQKELGDNQTRVEMARFIAQFDVITGNGSTIAKERFESMWVLCNDLWLTLKGQNMPTATTNMSQGTRTPGYCWELLYPFTATAELGETLGDLPRAARLWTAILELLDWNLTTCSLAIVDASVLRVCRHLLVCVRGSTETPYYAIVEKTMYNVRSVLGFTDSTLSNHEP